MSSGGGVAADSAWAVAGGGRGLDREDHREVL